MSPCDYDLPIFRWFDSKLFDRGRDFIRLHLRRKHSRDTETDEEKQRAPYLTTDTQLVFKERQVKYFIILVFLK